MGGGDVGGCDPVFYLTMLLFKIFFNLNGLEIDRNE